MNSLRKPWILALLAALALWGYAADLVECHHSAAGADQTEQHHAGDSSDDAGCQCICHSGYPAHTPLDFEIQGVFAVESFPRIQGTFPPDAMPLGIDTPPQLV